MSDNVAEILPSLTYYLQYSAEEYQMSKLNIQGFIFFFNEMFYQLRTEASSLNEHCIIHRVKRLTDVCHQLLGLHNAPVLLGNFRWGPDQYSIRYGYVDLSLEYLKNTVNKLNGILQKQMKSASHSYMYMFN